MRRVLPLAVLLTFFISNTFYSQVVIKEKVGINPKINSVSKSLAQHIIRVDLQWEPIDVPAAIIDYSDTHYYPCRSTGGTGWETGGNLSYRIIDAAGGNYNIQFRFSPPCNGQEEHARYSIYFDNDSVISGTFTIAGCFSLGSFPHYNLVYKSPLITDYSFQIYPKNLCIGEYGSVYYELGWGCTNVEIDTSIDNLNLQITAGNELVSFYKNGQSLGDNLEIPFSDVDDIDIIQDKFYSGNEIIVKLKSSLGDLIKYDSLLIFPKNRYKIAASECTYPLLYGEDFYMEVHIMGPGGCLAKLPPGITLDAEIVKGNDLGYLQDLDNGTSGDTLNNIPLQPNGKNHLKFISSGEMKANMDTAFVKFSISDEEINDIYVPVIFTPGPLLIDIQPPSLSPGETATITLKRRLLDGTIVDFDSTQTFEIGITDGCFLGNIVSDNDTGAYFYDVPQPIKFAADTAEGSSGEVKLRIAAVHEIILMNTKKDDKNKKGVLTNKTDSRKNYDKTTSLCFGGDFRMNDASIANIKIGNDIKSILLGETKYYQARYDSLLNKLLIEEIESGSDGIPKLNGGLASDVWGNNPVSVDTGKNYGKRMGVYWETEKPVWVDTVKKENLTMGLIRLIGRYWSKDSTYSITLRAKRNNTDSASIKIKIFKPKHLGNKHQEENDVLGNIFNVDSLCFYSSGEIGVPPQIVKGHIEKETTFRNSFRYEPKLDINIQNNKSKKKKFLDEYPFYTVTSSSMGTISMPVNHKNVKPVSYITSPTKIASYLVEKIGNYIRYPKKDKNGAWLNPFFIGYKNGEPSKKLQKAYSKMRDSLDMNGAMQFAIDSLKKWLKTDDFKDGNKYVQNRIFSSYGMLQQVFYYACTDKIAGYAINNDQQTPESLNEIKYSINAYKENMMKKIKNKTGNQWNNGFEDNWIKILQTYNKYETDYGKKVIKLSTQYLPN